MKCRKIACVSIILLAAAPRFAPAALPVNSSFASVRSALYSLRVMQFLIRCVGGGIRAITGLSAF